MLFPRTYARTCQACGYTWQLARWQVKLRPRMAKVWPRAAMMTATRGDLRGQMLRRASSVEDTAEQIAGYRRCPRCSSMRFDQRALPRGGAGGSSSR